METAKQVANPLIDTDVKPTFAVVESDRNSLYISLSQAAKTWHMYKGTVSRHVKEGKLQWHDQPDGSRKLFAPEVANLYGAPPGNSTETVSATSKPAPVTEAPTNADVTHLKAMLDAKEDMIRVLQSQLADQKAQIDRERQVAEQWRNEFTSMKDQVLALPAPKRDESKGFWLFRKK
ncbi:MAG TPA: hypothetical protein VGL56_20435 [Fimbriimonadaceae bacterium]|jgi:hypothetical protein